MCIINIISELLLNDFIKPYSNRQVKSQTVWLLFWLYSMRELICYTCQTATLRPSVLVYINLIKFDCEITLQTSPKTNQYSKWKSRVFAGWETTGTSDSVQTYDRPIMSEKR